MTVEELIHKLKKMPQMSEVVFCTKFIGGPEYCLPIDNQLTTAQYKQVIERKWDGFEQDHTHKTVYRQGKTTDTVVVISTTP